VIYLDAATNRSYTFSNVKKTAINFGMGLKDVWDWQKGDVMALFTPNCVDTPSVIWGTQWAGGAISPANPGYTVDELAFQLKDSGAKALITQWSYLDVAKAAADKVGLPYEKLILMGDERDPANLFKHVLDMQASSTTKSLQRTKMNPKDLAFLVYSSGTTGHPKGVSFFLVG
jgi:4-coumarate--CoA ligase